MDPLGWAEREAKEDPDADKDALADTVLEPLPVAVLDQAADAEAVKDWPAERLTKGEEVPVRLTVTVRVLVILTPPLRVPAGVFVPVALGRGVFETVLVFVAVVDVRGDFVPVDVLLAETDGRGERVAEGDRVPVRVAVAV